MTINMRLDTDDCRSLHPTESYLIKELSAGMKGLQSSVSNLMLMITAVVAAAAPFLVGQSDILNVLLSKVTSAR